MKKTKKIPTILGLLLLMFGIGTGVYLTQSNVIFKLRASEDTKPQDVRISNITDSSFTISWITDRSTTGFLSYGTDSFTNRTQNPDNLNLKQTHLITVRNLSPNTLYFFKINSAGLAYSDNVWQIQTASEELKSQETRAISGNVNTQTGEPASEILVYVSASNLSQLSTKTSANGSFIIPLNSARSVNNQGLASFTPNMTLQIFAQGGSKGISTASVVLESANPIPPIVLGQNHDFRDLKSIDNSTIPKASLDMLDASKSAELQSKFELNQENTQTTQTPVTLKSVTNGEIITTTSPEFFGDGPPGTNITITIHSDPINGQTKVSQSGNWRWSPPKNLPEGEHTVTLSWRDTAGILRSIERNFIVSAQEGPAFESTPSGVTPKPSPSPTPKLTPSPSPSPTVSVSPSATPRLSLPSTDSGTPIAGSLTPTLLLSIIGIGLLTFGVYISLKASN